MPSSYRNSSSDDLSLETVTGDPAIAAEALKSGGLLFAAAIGGILEMGAA